MGKVERAFSEVRIGGVKLWHLPRRKLPEPPSLDLTLEVLDYFYLEAGLLSAYGPEYPLVEPRELIPSFDAPLIEYRDLPAFSLVSPGPGDQLSGRRVPVRPPGARGQTP